jgi:hypothetical protein
VLSFGDAGARLIAWCYTGRPLGGAPQDAPGVWSRCTGTLGNSRMLVICLSHAAAAASASSSVMVSGLQWPLCFNMQSSASFAMNQCPARQLACMLSAVQHFCCLCCVLMLVHATQQAEEATAQVCELRARLPTVALLCSCFVDVFQSCCHCCALWGTFCCAAALDRLRRRQRSCKSCAAQLLTVALFCSC